MAGSNLKNFDVGRYLWQRQRHVPSAALSWHENEYHIICYLQSGMYETVLRIVVSSSLRSIVGLILYE